MKKKSMIGIFILIGIILTNVPLKSVSADSGGEYPFQPTDKVIIEALNFLKNQQLKDGSIGGFAVSSWVAMAISAVDENAHDWGNLVNYLTVKNYLLNSNKATDWERQTLAIVACDENPRDFGGINFVTKTESFYNGVQIGDNVNLYDDFFGVLALISSGVDKDKSIIQNVISHIKGKQNNNGDWGDVDSTSIAVMALIAAGENPNSEIINDAFLFIKSTQTDSGGFQAWGTTNAASTSWAVDAIVATGQDPTSIEWEKNGNSPVDFLLSLQQNDGSFNWANDQSMNPEWMTSYVIPALLGKPYPIKISESNNNANNANQESDNNEYDNTYLNEWSGDIRFEGKTETVWDGTVTVGESNIYAKNVDTGEIEEYYIPYPSVLGAVDEASKLGNFTYAVEYWPNWDAFLVKTIENDSDWWHYWVDYTLPMVDAGKYNLTDEDNEIIFGYLENWYAHALKIIVDKTVVKKNEEFTVSVFDESDFCIEGATVYVGSETYLTDENGNVTVSCDKSGTLKVYAEKDDFVRSEKTSIKVKKSIEIVKPFVNRLNFIDLKFDRTLKKTWVFGAVDIEIDTSEDVKKVDFYINDKLVYSDEERPFKYNLNERAFFKKNKIMVKSYLIETLSYKNLFNNISKILEKIRSIHDKNELKTSFDLLESYFNHFEKTVFKEEDTDTEEVIIINLFPNLHK